MTLSYSCLHAVKYSWLILQIVGGANLKYYENETANPSGCQVDNEWVDLDTDLYHWTKALRPVQVRIGCGYGNYTGNF